IAVVDAATGFATLRWAAEARKQIILADRLLISKTDLAEPSAIEHLRARLRTLNADAAIDRVVHGEIDPLCLVEAPSGPGRELGFGAEADHSDGIRASFSPTMRRLRGTRSRTPWRPSLPCGVPTCCGSRDSSMSRAAEGRCLCSSCSISRILRSSLRPGPMR